MAKKEDVPSMQCSYACFVACTMHLLRGPHLLVNKKDNPRSYPKDRPQPPDVVFDLLRNGQQDFLRNGQEGKTIGNHAGIGIDAPPHQQAVPVSAPSNRMPCPGGSHSSSFTEDMILQGISAVLKCLCPSPRGRPHQLLQKQQLHQHLQYLERISLNVVLMIVWELRVSRESLKSRRAKEKKVSAPAEGAGHIRFFNSSGSTNTSSTESGSR